MIDPANFETAFIIFAVTFAALIIAGIAVVVAHARRPGTPADTGESGASGEMPATAPVAERHDQLVG